MILLMKLNKWKGLGKFQGIDWKVPRPWKVRGKVNGDEYCCIFGPEKKFRNFLMSNLTGLGLVKCVGKAPTFGSWKYQIKCLKSMGYKFGKNLHKWPEIFIKILLK